ncbi:hypothetical protein [Flavobacterium sp.]|uniref:HYC_CC_PP family protein n=1 Tax=Flavobacterium sp. TaxID=239 RepID=UPI0035282877
MIIKKLTAILLTVFILFSNLGLAFNVHYCHNEIASVSINFKQNETCNATKNTCCSNDDNHSKCCSDKVIKADEKADNILVKSFQLDLQFFVLQYSNWYKLTTNIVSVIQKKIIENYCESNSPPLYKLYCKLVLYA